MKLNQIVSSINYFLNKLLGKKRKKKNKYSLNNIEQTSFTKRKKIFSFKYKKNNKFKSNLKIIHYYGIIFLILIAILIYILFGPIFRVKKVNIIKQDNITNMIIAYKAIDPYRGKSLFNIDKKDILKNLQDYQNNIEDIKISISLPNSLNIVINSYKGIFNTNINNKNFIITENGTLIPSSYSKELKELIIKEKFNKNIFLDYKKIFEVEYINKINNIINSLEENIINIKIKENTYFVKERELHIKTDNNIIIIFDLNGEYKKQIEKIVIFNKEYTNLSKSQIIYIDLRIKNKIFYCTNEKEYQCIQNYKSVYLVK